MWGGLTTRAMYPHIAGHGLHSALLNHGHIRIGRDLARFLEPLREQP
jgi:hypothetical protein